MVRGQVELADAAGNRGALLDRHQPLVVAQMRADLSRLRQHFAGHAVDVRQKRVENVGVDRGIAAQASEQLLLPLELLQDVGLEIGARGDVGDLEERRERRVMLGRLAS